jgi:hypothetical protein
MISREALQREVEAATAKDRCAVPGCEKTSRGRRYCSAHRDQLCRHGEITSVAVRPWGVVAQCKVDGCENKSSSRGWCAAHYQRFLRGTKVDGPLQQRRKHEDQR